MSKLLSPERLEEIRKIRRETRDLCNWGHVGDLLDHIDALSEQVSTLVAALERMGLQCINTGMYGPMGIRPGQCTCSNCEAKEVIAQHLPERSTR